MRVFPRKQRTVRWFGMFIAAATCVSILPAQLAGGAGRWGGTFIASATCVSILPAQLAGGVGSTGALEFDSPSGLAFGGGHLWVSNEMGNSVSEINPTNSLWIATLNSKIY